MAKCHLQHIITQKVISPDNLVNSTVKEDVNDKIPQLSMDAQTER